MKANVRNNTTATPVVPETTMPASEIAAVLAQATDLATMAREAINSGMTEADFIRCVSMSYFNSASDLDTLKRMQDDAVGAFKKAIAEKAETDDTATYQSMLGLDRILVQITEAMIDFGDSTMAGLVQALLEENASKVRIGFEVGKNFNNKDMMQDLKYIVRALKMEPSTSGPWANRLIEVYSEIFNK